MITGLYFVLLHIQASIAYYFIVPYWGVYGKIIVGAVLLLAWFLAINKFIQWKNKKQISKKQTTKKQTNSIQWGASFVFGCLFANFSFIGIETTILGSEGSQEALLSTSNSYSYATIHHIYHYKKSKRPRSSFTTPEHWEAEYEFKDEKGITYAGNQVTEVPFPFKEKDSVKVRYVKEKPAISKLLLE